MTTDQIELMKVKKDIFVAVISNGSHNQKECWKEQCEKVYDWVVGTDTAKAPVTKTTK